MTRDDKLSVVVAVQHAEANLPDILRALSPETRPDIEFLICHTGADPAVPALLPAADNVRPVRGADGSLIPHLWRDGIRAARGGRVAVTTAHCVPAPDWLERLRQHDLADCAGIGGVIENDPASDAKGWAVYLLRYAAFAPPQQARAVAEIAADNALYRRAEIVRHGALLERGFWEPSFHARFAAAGLGLRLDPGLRVVHRNRYRARQFLGQRLAHGREFGLERARGAGPARRLALLALAPLAPVVFFAKLCARGLGRAGQRRRFVRALPWLVAFMLSWNAGEAYGYFLGALNKGKN